jgi:hypothetical protein
MGEAEVVDVEEVGRERVTPVVALAPISVDVDAHRILLGQRGPGP